MVIHLAINTLIALSNLLNKTISVALFDLLNEFQKCIELKLYTIISYFVGKRVQSLQIGIIRYDLYQR